MPPKLSLSRRHALASAAAAPLALSAAPSLVRASAPKLGPARPTHYRFALGGFEVTTLLDGAIELEGPHPIFGEDQPADAVEALAEANFLPADRMEIAFTPVLVNTGDHLVLFDSGNGPGRRPNAGRLAEVIRAAGHDPEAVDTVVITHFHPDHIGGLMEADAPVYPEARYATAEVEYDFWTKEERLSGPTEGVARLTRANVVPLAERMRFLKDESEVVPGIRAIAAFGHTPGHMAFHIESEGERLLLWADTANHYVLSVQRPDWHVRFDMDKEAASATRRRLFDMAASERLPVIGYHMPFPAVGFIDRTDESWRWVPASYQMHL